MLNFVFMMPVLGSLLISFIGRIDGQAGRVLLTEDGFDSPFLNLLGKGVDQWDHRHFFMLRLFNSLFRNRKLQTIVDDYRLARQDWITASRTVEPSGSTLLDRRRALRAERARNHYVKARRRLLKEGKAAADRICMGEKRLLRRRDTYLASVRHLACGYLNAAGFVTDHDLPLTFSGNAEACYKEKRVALRQYREAVTSTLKDKEVTR